VAARALAKDRERASPQLNRPAVASQEFKLERRRVGAAAERLATRGRAHVRQALTRLSHEQHTSPKVRKKTLVCL
jgi:hypothetical protein